MKALCVASWNHVEIGPWVMAARPEMLGSANDWTGIPVDELHPEVEAELTSVTSIINHNNTISAGFEKDVVVEALLRLHDSGHRLDGRTFEGWALANGWRGKNPARLAKYADEIAGGSGLERVGEGSQSSRRLKSLFDREMAPISRPPEADPDASDKREIGVRR